MGEFQIQFVRRATYFLEFPNMTTKLDNIIVVGAGPSGLLLALMLGQHGIRVDVVEALDGLDKRPRGVAYGPAAAV